MTTKRGYFAVIVAVFAIVLASCNSHAEDPGQMWAADQITSMTLRMNAAYNAGKLPSEPYAHLFATRTRAMRLVTRWSCRPDLANDAIQAFMEFQGEFQAFVGGDL